MKKKTLSLMLLSAISFFNFSYGQNLVPNPSFEDYSICVNSVGEVYKAIGWRSYRNSPDYFNTCASDTLVSVPDNGLGYQYPHSGNAYCGFFSFGIPNTQPNYREILGTVLNNSMSMGVKYYVSFYLNLSYGDYYLTRIASNKIGVLFTTTPYDSSLSPALINNYSTIYIDSIITDTLNWVEVFTSFTSDSSYQYMYVGNFYDAINTDTIMFPSATTPLGAYYFIDDICVSTDSVYAQTWTGILEKDNIEDIIIYPSLSTGIIKVEAATRIEKIEVYNIVGEEIIVKNISENQIEILQDGIYLIVVNTGKSKICKKVLIIR